ncbi:NADPH:quinone reductase [Roseateles noduli]|uniref:NADPH:quinone reductase n=1 Tax=Roseateles noduli TaxID=2052484 RepID=UPI003D64A4D5
MKAAWYEATGAAREVLKVGERPDPIPASGEVRVRLHFSGVNPSDVKNRQGLRSSVMPFPWVIPHSDGAGEIDAVGPGVPRERIGERVWVWNAAWQRHDGTAAEAVVVPARQAVALPDSVALDTGAVLGIPAMTAMHAVIGYGGVRGKSVVVTGGAGTVGQYAIQFCKQLGASQVLATVSGSEKAEMAMAAGADATIDYKTEPVHQRTMELTDGAGVDRVIEVDLAANAGVSPLLLKAGGDLVAYGSGPEIKLNFFPLITRHLSLRFFIVYSLADADRLAAQDQLRALLDAGLVKHRVGFVTTLEDIASAHEAVESGRTVGSVLVKTR